MLGRTDHRGRLLVVLAVVFLVAGAASVRAAQWQVVERDRLVALAEQQTSIRVEERMQRGTIYDRTRDGRPRLDGGEGPARGLAGAAGARRARRGRDLAHLDPGPDREGGGDASRHVHDRRAVRGPPDRPRPRDLRPDPRCRRGRDDLRRLPRAAARARLPAGRRREGLDPRRARPRLRERRRRRAVRRGELLPGRARRHPARSSTPSATSRAGRCGTRRGSRSRASRARTCA